MDDEAIIRLFFERSDSAVAELSARYGPLCRKTAAGILRDARDAEECVNDTWLAVWNAVPPERPEHLSAYVCRIVRNLALKKAAANRAEKRGGGQYEAALEEIAEVFPSTASVWEAVDAGETARAIDRFLSAQKQEDRVMFVRRYWYGETIEDLAELFGMNAHRVSVRLYRIRKKLRTYLASEGVWL